MEAAERIPVQPERLPKPGQGVLQEPGGRPAGEQVHARASGPSNSSRLEEGVSVHQILPIKRQRGHRLQQAAGDQEAAQHGNSVCKDDHYGDL